MDIKLSLENLAKLLKSLAKVSLSFVSVFLGCLFLIENFVFSPSFRLPTQPPPRISSVPASKQFSFFVCLYVFLFVCFSFFVFFVFLLFFFFCFFFFGLFFVSFFNLLFCIFDSLQNHFSSRRKLLSTFFLSIFAVRTCLAHFTSIRQRLNIRATTKKCYLFLILSFEILA